MERTICPQNSFSFGCFVIRKNLNRIRAVENSPDIHRHEMSLCMKEHRFLSTEQEF